MSEDLVLVDPKPKRKRVSSKDWDIVRHINDVVRDLEYFELSPRKAEVLTIPSQILYNHMLPMTEKFHLYHEKWFYYRLKESGIDDVLVSWGFPRLNLVDRSACTSLQFTLHNLWRSQMIIRKFALEFFTPSAGGKPNGVRWLFKW